MSAELYAERIMQGAVYYPGVYVTKEFTDTLRILWRKRVGFKVVWLSSGAPAVALRDTDIGLDGWDASRERSDNSHWCEGP